MILLIWSAVQYTGGWEDYLMLAICSIAGIGLKQIKFSRPALIIGFVLADKLEGLVRQFERLYAWSDVLHRPLSVVLLAIVIVAVVYGIFFNKTRINYV
jgi:TctA family transporter